MFNVSQFLKFWFITVDEFKLKGQWLRYMKPNVEIWVFTLRLGEYAYKDYAKIIHVAVVNLPDINIQN